METRFEWDPEKAESNYRKHRVRFSTAQLAVLDPNAFVEVDESVEDEVRLRLIGKAGPVLLFVVFTLRQIAGDDVVRLISARLASRRERKLYETEMGNKYA